MTGQQPSRRSWSDIPGEEVFAGAQEVDDGSESPPAPWDFLDDDPSHPRRRRGRLAFAAAALPWIVLVLLLARPLNRAAPPSPPLPEDAGEAATGPTASTSPSSAPSSQEASAGVRFGGRVAVGPGDAAAVAVAVARAWLGDVGPPLDLGLGRAGTGAYVEHLTVEAVDHPAPGAAVVTLVAVLLDADRGAYRSARVVRLGVPVRLDSGGAHPAGSPWWLPAPELTAAPPKWTPVAEQPELAEAGAALEGVGYRSVEVRSLERSDGWPWRVVVVATAPGAATAAEHSVWLRDHLGQLVVAGWLPLRQSPARSPEPVEAPRSSETR